jgi:hypothetical protein
MEPQESTNRLPSRCRALRALIRRMQAENFTWGAPRTHGKLIKIGLSLSEASLSKYVKKYRKPPPKSWRGFRAGRS